MKLFIIAILTLLIIQTNNIYSQNHTLNGNFLSAVRIDNNSSGYSINFNYTFSVRKTYFTLGFGQTYTHKKRPQQDEGYTVFSREKGNLGPLGSDFGWTESSFHNINFDPKESNYMNLDFFFMYKLKGDKKNRLAISVGPLFSIRDHKQIERYIYFKEYNFPIAFLEDIAVPVYSYASYLDLGLLSEVKYTLKKIGRMDLDLLSRIKYYPVNGDVFVELGVNIGIRLKPNEKDRA